MSDMAKLATLMAKPVNAQTVISDALHTMRTHLGMDVAYLSEFLGDEIVFRAVDTATLDAPIAVGDTRAIDDTYCKYIAAGEMPNLIQDAQELPLCCSLPVSGELGMRAHLSIPIRRRDGSVYGMFCCYATRPIESLNDRDLQLMKVFSRLVETEMRRNMDANGIDATLIDLLHRTMAERRYQMVFQPIFDLASDTLIGVEALCRFQSEPYRPPNLWFEDAAAVGMAETLEVAVIETALEALDHLPGTAYLSVNASPETISSGLLLAALDGVPSNRVVIEVTEHVAVADWAALDRALANLRAHGFRIAIDDAGAGYAGLQHMVRLRPDIIKLDRSLVEGIDRDQARRSLCAAMIHYATETGAVLVAEGIETESEVQVLRSLGVTRGQGFHLARPAPLDTVLKLTDTPAQAAAE